MTGFAIIPLIQGVTKPIKRILNSHDVKVAQKPFQTLGHIFAILGHIFAILQEQ